MHSNPGESLLLLMDAQAASPAGGFMSTLPLLVAILAIFYFLMIRPQQKQVKEHQELLSSLKKDDRVITSSGIHGKIWAVEDDTIVVEIARDVRVRIDKAAVRRRSTEGATEISGDSKGDKKSRRRG